MIGDDEFISALVNYSVSTVVRAGTITATSSIRIPKSLSL